MIHDNKGMTLIELMIVLAIVGILAATAVMTYIGQQKRATYSEAKANLQSIRLLEEQFFADSGKYTVSLGTPGKDNPGNVTVIQTGNGDPTNALPGFKPGNGLSFSYWIVQDVSITNTAANPPTTAAAASCFVAFAAGNTASRVNNEVFAIDCNNNKNF